MKHAKCTLEKIQHKVIVLDLFNFFPSISFDDVLISENDKRAAFCVIAQR